MNNRLSLYFSDGLNIKTQYVHGMKNKPEKIGDSKIFATYFFSGNWFFVVFPFYFPFKNSLLRKKTNIPLKFQNKKYIINQSKTWFHFSQISKPLSNGFTMNKWLETSHLLSEKRFSSKKKAANLWSPRLSGLLASKATMRRDHVQKNQNVQLWRKTNLYPSSHKYSFQPGYLRRNSSKNSPYLSFVFFSAYYDMCHLLNIEWKNIPMFDRSDRTGKDYKKQLKWCSPQKENIISSKIFIPYQYMKCQFNSSVFFLSGQKYSNSLKTQNLGKDNMVEDNALFSALFPFSHKRKEKEITKTLNNMNKHSKTANRFSPIVFSHGTLANERTGYAKRPDMRGDLYQNKFAKQANIPAKFIYYKKAILYNLNTNSFLTTKKMEDNNQKRLKQMELQPFHINSLLQANYQNLQIMVNVLIDNNQKLQSLTLLENKNRLYKSLSGILKGKQGRFRQNILGKRVDYSGRSVIVVGPNLKVHECGIPIVMALKLFQPFIILYLMKVYNATHNMAISLIKKKHPVVLNVVEKYLETWPILLNRAPTLHRMNIQAFKIRLVQGKSILLHPLVCSSFNADFDGDQMGVHIPLTQESRIEAWKLLWSLHNSINLASRQPLFLPSQDLVIGNYFLTKDPFFQYLIPFDSSFFYTSKKPEKDKPYNQKALYGLPNQLSKQVSTQNKKESFQSLLNRKDGTEKTRGGKTTPNLLNNKSLSLLPFFDKKTIYLKDLLTLFKKFYQKKFPLFNNIEEAYKYYSLNVMNNAYLNSPVWFYSFSLFETSEREKQIEFLMDKKGYHISISKYYEIHYKKNRFQIINLKNNRLNSFSSLKKNQTNFHFVLSEIAKGYFFIPWEKRFLFQYLVIQNHPDSYVNLYEMSSQKKTGRLKNYFSKTFINTIFNFPQKKTSKVVFNRQNFLFSISNKVSLVRKKKQVFGPAALFNQFFNILLSMTTLKFSSLLVSIQNEKSVTNNLCIYSFKPISTNQILRSTFGRIEFYLNTFEKI
uniref:DNA-directed RNA polymerase n=1 Tax=Trentepohlia odorata TaxID=2576626 RepID=A0A4Y5P3I7_9CHLO|nr:rna polymerase beta'-subunit [Trentepohlia odorata]QCW57824.1 rna polymerase beta'-subunit [Trentepohlia odorata]